MWVKREVKIQCDQTREKKTQHNGSAMYSSFTRRHSGNSSIGIRYHYSGDSGISVLAALVTRYVFTQSDRSIRICPLIGIRSLNQCQSISESIWPHQLNQHNRIPATSTRFFPNTHIHSSQKVKRINSVLCIVSY